MVLSKKRNEELTLGSLQNPADNKPENSKCTQNKTGQPTRRRDDKHDEMKGKDVNSRKSAPN
jgi:hypothetical protein